MVHHSFTYVGFAGPVEELIDASGLNCTRRELDRYLWLAGAYRRWRARKGETLNRDLVGLFEHGASEVAALVRDSADPSVP